MILEAAIDNFKVAELLVKNGANRLEVCSDLSNDGLTPSVDLFLKCKSLNVPCFAMIRPNKGDFIINKSILLIMKKQIELYKSLSADGIVLGLLNTSRDIDIHQIKDLVDLANPLPVTFHKAIDTTRDILRTTENLLKTGVKRILTSGGKETVEQGIDIIKQMYKIVGEKIILVAGGKVNYENLNRIKLKLPFCEFHGKNIVKYNSNE